MTNADYLTRYIGAAPPITPKNTPFQNFITAFNSNTTINNEEHIDILRRNGDWVADEINGIHPAANCSFICSNSGITISGPNIICNNPLVYTLNNPPAGTIRTWSATPAGIVNIAPSPDGSQATITRSGNGNITLQVTISNANCGSLIVSTPSIRAGSFVSSEFPITGPSTTCPNTYISFSTVALPGATNYNWFWPNDWTYYSGQGTPYLALIASSNGGMVGVGVGNACNSNPSPATKFVFINYCGGWGFSASPNPSHGQTTIATTQTQAQSAKELSQTKIYQIKILDQSGIILKQYSYSGGITNTAINLSNLVGGVYLIQAFNGSTWASQQILKQ